MKKYYHATIKEKLDKILKDKAIKPGQDSPLPMSKVMEYEFWGLYDHYSKEHVYAWQRLKDAKENAISLSQEAAGSLEERLPVVIPFFVDEKRVSKDPDCKTGVMILGPVKNFEKPIIVKKR